MALLEELTDIGKKILVVSPHPDDAEFSAGRLILRREGKNTFVIYMTDGRKGQDANEKNPVSEDEYARIREAESRAAMSEFKVDKESLFFMGIPDQGVIVNPYIIDKISLLIRKLSPDFLLIPPWEGAHPDHDTTHLFCIIAARNIGFDNKNIIEYGSYNNYNGKMHVQEFIPIGDSEESELVPDREDQLVWRKIMQNFLSQASLHEKYIPKSERERFRPLPGYDYTKLPYSSEQSKILRELLSSVYPIARKILPKKDRMFYETWKDNIDPSEVKDKLNEYVKHYVMK